MTHNSIDATRATWIAEELRSYLVEQLADLAADVLHVDEPQSIQAIADRLQTLRRFVALTTRDDHDTIVMPQLHERRSHLAERANIEAKDSRRGAAPKLTATSSAEQVAAWLQWNDPNGCHTAELARHEDQEPYTDETAWDALAEMLEDA